MMGGLLPSPGSAPRAPSLLVFLLAAIVGPLALASIALQVGAQFRDAAALRTLIRESCEERVNAAELMASFAQTESAGRGYVITGDRAFLVSYAMARAHVAASMAKADSFDADEVGQAARVARLRTLIDARMGEIAQVIAIRTRDGLPAAAARIGANRSVAPADAALAAATRLNDTEAAAMAARIAVARDRYATCQHLLRGVALLSGLLMLAGLGLLWRSRAHRFVLERNAHDTSVRLLAMFAGNADATFILDPEGRIEAANVAVKRLIGCDITDLIGRDVITLFDFEDHRDFATRIGLVDGKLTQPYWFDRTIRHSDGSGVPVDIAIGLLDLPDGLRIIMTMRDIAERKTVERLKDEFLATISHELRTPLTSVIGALGLLRNGSAGALPEAADRLVEIAENNSRRLIRLVNDLLDIEKIGTGRMRFERLPIDLLHVAQAALDGARGIAEARGIRLESTATRSALVVQGDRDRLVQVLANLLSNAVRFSPEDGTVLVSLAERNGQAIVTVDDQGPGIPADFNGRIFERFAQATDAPIGGSGLGLAISREIVVAHDGRIWFGRAPGRRGGARFTVALPLARRETAPPPARARILIGGADTEAAEVLRRILETDGCAADIVTTGNEAEAAARSGRYDALLFDVALADAGGLEVIHALRRHAETRSLPAIVMSSEALADTVGIEGAALDLVDWIEKPVDPARLIKAVRRAIEHSARARPTLLHIDGDVDMLEVAAVALAEHGRVVHATSLASARAVLRLQAPDIVILDLGLPDGSGAELLPELRRSDGAPIPTIIYSALDAMPEVERQVDAVLVKSRRSLNSLSRAIQRILASHAD